MNRQKQMPPASGIHQDVAGWGSQNIWLILIAITLFLAGGSRSAVAADNALLFDGTTGIVERANNGGSVAGTFTVECWVRPANTTNILAILGSRTPSDASLDLKLINGGLIYSDIGNGSSWISTGVTNTFNYSAGTWYHIAYVVTSTGYTAYVNGVQIGSGSFSSNTPLLFDSTHRLRIGGTGFPGENMNGAIDDVRVWSVARTQAQISGNMNRTLAGTESGLAAYWRFDEGTGTAAKDEVTGVNATLTGSGVTWQSSSAPVNAVPSANVQSVTTAEDTPLAITLTGSDYETAVGNLSFAVTVQPTKGTLSGTAPNLTYTPSANTNGTDSFTFTVTDTADGSAPALTSTAATVSITITAVNDTPVANAQSVTTDEDTPLAITLTGSDVEAAAASLSYAVTIQPTKGTLTGTAPNLTYTPSANTNGTDSFSFTVTDAGASTSAAATVSITITAVNDTPIANAQSVTTVENTPLAITLTGSDVETPAASLSYVVTVQPAKGTLSGTAPNLTYTPSANTNGADSFSFTVTDAGASTSAAATVSITITVVNDTPVANAQSVTTVEDTPLAITLTGSDTETAAASLSYAVTIQPTKGTLTGTAPNLTYTPSANTNGTDSFSFTVTDAGASTSAAATVSITITAVNDAPVANAQSVTTPEDASIATTLTGSDAEGSSLTFSLVATNGGAQHGAVTLSGNVATYTPSTNYSGSDSFSFAVHDGTTNSAPATVSLTVTGINDSPIAHAQSITLAEDTVATIMLTGTNSEGGTLTFALVSTNGSATNGTVTLAGNVATYRPNTNFAGLDAFRFTVTENGVTTSLPATVSLTVTNVNDAPVAVAADIAVAQNKARSFTLTGSDADGDPLTFALVLAPTNGTVVIATNGPATYTPNTNYFGSDTFRFKVNDGRADSAPTAVTLSVSPSGPPQIKAPTSVQVDEDNSTNVAFTFSSGVPNVLTTARSSNTNLVTDLTITGTGTNRTLRIAPLTNAFGSATIQLVADNQQGGIATNLMTLTVNAVNDRPGFALSTTNVVIAEDTQLSLTNFAINLSAGPANESSQTLRFFVTGPTNLFTVAPAISTNGILSFKPLTNASGQSRLDVYLQDSGDSARGGTNRSPLQAFTINITNVNDAPTFTSLKADYAVDEDRSTNIVFILNDVDTAITNVVVMAKSSNTNLVRDANLVITGTGTNRTLAIAPVADANGTNTILLIAEDRSGGRTTNSFRLVINPVNDVPSFSLSTTNLTVPEDTAIVITNFAGNIRPGPANEFSQKIRFLFTGPTNGFAIRPSIAANGTLSFQPTTNFFGILQMGVSLEDDGDSARGGTNRSPVLAFTINVTNVNDAPTFKSLGTAYTISEDRVSNLAFVVTDVDTAITNVVVTAWSSNTNLIRDTNLVITVTSTNRILKMTPVTNANGTNTIQLIADDGMGGRTTNSFRLVISPVNDVPRFSLSTTNIVADDDTPFTLTNFAFNINAGAPDESSQTLRFIFSGPTDRFAAFPSIGANGTLSFKPAPNFAGAIPMGVSLQDSGDSAQGGTNKSATRAFTINVRDVNNTLPVFLQLSKEYEMNEDSSININFMVLDTDTPITNVVVTALSSNTNLVRATNLVVTGGSQARTVSIRPVADANGTNTISLIADDGRGGRRTNSIRLLIHPVNDAPSFSLSTTNIVADQNVPFTLPNFASNFRAGPTNESSQTLRLLFTSSGPTAQFAQFPSISSNGTLSFRSASHFFGTIGMAVSVLDSGDSARGGTNQSPYRAFTIQIVNVNSPPVFTPLKASYTLSEDKTGNVPFVVNDFDTAITNVVVTATSSNTNLVRDANLEITGTGTNRNLRITPLANANGTNTIVLIAEDGIGGRATNSFRLVITPANDAPSFSLSTTNIIGAEDTRFTLTNFAFNLSAGPANESSQTLRFRMFSIASASNPPPKFATLPSVTTNGTLSFQTETNFFGVFQMGVSLEDSGDSTLGGTNGSPMQRFTVNITNVNDAPRFSPLNAEYPLKEDNTATLTFSVKDAETALTNLVVRARSSNTNLVRDTNLVITGTSSNWSLRITPVAHANGTNTILLTADDGSGGRATNSFRLVITPVNDIPFFALATTNVVVTVNSPVQTITNFAHTIQAGPSDERQQSLTFLATPAIAANFSIAPRVTTNGTLTFKLATNVVGTNLVTLKLTDSGSPSASRETVFRIVSRPAATLANSASGAEKGVSLQNATSLALTRALQAARLGTAFHVSVATAVGKTYTLEFRNALDEGHWAPLDALPGDGTMQTLTDPSAISPQRFYRVRIDSGEDRPAPRE
jgi:VCBS repeat-containing protein